MYFDPGNGKFVMVDGHVVERDALYIAEKIKDYDEDLELVCFDPSQMPELTTAPFKLLWRRPSDGNYIQVMEFWELDDRILERIYAADRNRFSALETIEGMEARLKKVEEDRYRESVGEANEIMLAALRNPTTSFSLRNKQGDKITLNDEGPVTYNNNRKTFS